MERGRIPDRRPDRMRLPFIFLFCVLLASIYEKYIATYYTPIIETKFGALRGILAESREGKLYYQFLGIPYAQPPIDAWRYEPPVPLHFPWHGVPTFSKYRSMCMQVNSITKSIEGNEDCLYLNIFSPQFAEGYSYWNRPLLPVFVFIHGGYFMAGTSKFNGPSYLMEQDIVLVTVNYRLNSFGFLNTGDGVIRGNMGLKDQVTALDFIKKIIKTFGGDPENIVLWGESAGAASVHFHLLSRQSAGLFQKAIMSSGNAIKPWSLVNDPVQQANLFSKTVGCSRNDTVSMVECLKELDADTLIRAHMDALDTPVMDPRKIFAPSIEVVCDGKEFLCEHPYDVLREGRAHKVPTLTGVNSHEGLLATARMYFNPGMAHQLERKWDRLCPKVFAYPASYVNVTQKIRNFYFGDQKKLNFYRNFNNFTNVFSDRWYIHPFKETTRIQSHYSPTYMYFFNYPLQRGLIFFYDMTPHVTLHLQVFVKFIYEYLKWFLIGYRPVYLGTVHGDELVLLFDFPALHIDVSHRDYKMSRLLIETWHQFALDPHSVTVGSQRWLMYNSSRSEKPMYMFFRLRKNPKERGIMIDEPFSNRMAFWDELGLPWKSEEYGDDF